MHAAPGYGNGESFGTFSDAQQKEYLAAYDAKYPSDLRTPEPVKEIKFDAPQGDDAHKNHFTNFFEGIKYNKAVIEDPLFGFRAAAPVLACNKSYFEKKVIKWDAKNLKLLP